MGTSYQKKRLKPLSTKRTFEKIKNNPNNKCIICKKIVEPNFMICRSVRLYRECYSKKMEQQKKVSIKFLSFSKKSFAGNEILDNKLYLGNEHDSFLKEKLKSIGITNIIVLGYKSYNFYPEDFEYKIIEVVDIENEDILKYFIPIIIYYSNIKGKCFIHCQAGMSRSASFVIAIIMYFKKMNFQDAYNFVLHKRKIICPNYGFIEQLIEFQEMLELINYKFKFLQPMQNIIFEKDDF